MGSDLWAQMTLVFRERNHARALKPNYFEISAASLRNQELDTGRMIIANAENPEKAEDALDITPETWRYVKNNLYLETR